MYSLWISNHGAKEHISEYCVLYTNLNQITKLYQPVLVCTTKSRTIQSQTSQMGGKISRGFSESEDASAKFNFITIWHSQVKKTSQSTERPRFLPIQRDQSLGRQNTQKARDSHLLLQKLCTILSPRVCGTHEYDGTSHH